MVAVLAASAALMVVGYLTDGFGGILDPKDRGAWLFSWAAALVFLPAGLATLCWMTVWRSLFAQHITEASGVAAIQLFSTLGCVNWALYEVGSRTISLGMGLILAGASLSVMTAFASHASRNFLARFRSLGTDVTVL